MRTVAYDRARARQKQGRKAAGNVWLYAAIRPRYGTGAKTALCAGAAVWGLGYLLAAVGPIALHLFPRHIMAIGLAVGLVEVLVGTVAGAWLYREGPA